MKVRVIREWACSKCGDPLNPLCPKCVKHPNRKPKIVAEYSLPTESEVCNKCGHGVRIVCQVDPSLRPADCKRVVWRAYSNASRKRVLKDLFCGKHCASIMTGVSRRSRQTFLCANPKCNKEKGKRKSFELRTGYLKTVASEHYCCTSCRWIHHRIKRLTEQKERLDYSSRQLFSCPSAKCRGEVTEHVKAANNRYVCDECKSERNGVTDMSLLNRETYARGRKDDILHRRLLPAGDGAYQRIPGCDASV